MDTTIARKKKLGELHDLILDACPPDEDGVKSVTVLAGLLGISPYAVYKWLKKGKVSGRRARQITGLEGCPKVFEDFIPYIY